MPATRHVVPDVEQLRFGPESDNYCQALRIALQHRGESVGYREISSWSGRAFSTCWNDQYYFWDQHLSAPDPDAEGYLRSDFLTARAAIERLGYECTVLANADGLAAHDRSTDNQHADMAHVDTRLTVADSAAIRSALCSEIDTGHPVLAQFSLSPDRWAPEWTLFTGYDDGGATVIGWSFFQEDEEHASGILTEESGQFRLTDWEHQTTTLVQISGQPAAGRDINALEKQAAQEAVTRSQGPVGSQAAQPCEHLTWGLAAFDRWAAAIEAPDHADVADHVLLGRLRYHGHLVGHLAAQKWYSSDCLRHGQHSPWTAAGVLQAAAAWATFHERMWDIWDVAGGFWRDEQEELVKFRSQVARDRVAALIRQARDLDAAAATHLQTALDRWDRSHGDYMNH